MLCARRLRAVQHDAHYKRLFGHPRMAGDLLVLLRDGLGEQFPILKRIKHDTLQRLSGEFVSDDLLRRFADLIWKMHLSEPAGTARRAPAAPDDTTGDLSGSQKAESMRGSEARGHGDHGDHGDNAARSGRGKHGNEGEHGVAGGHGDGGRDTHPALGDHWLYLVVLLEFQSTVDWMMAVWVQDYAMQLWLDIHRRQPFGRNRTPPPILPVVVYNGDPPWNAPTRVVDLWRPKPASGDRAAFGGIEAGPLQFFGDGFVLLDLQAVEGDELPNDNGVAWLARVESLDDKEALLATLDGLFRWLEDSTDGTLASAVLGWMQALSESRQLLETGEFEMAVQAAEGRKRRQGHWVERVYQDHLRRMAQAKAEGREEGEALGLERERTLLSHLASRRFGAEAARRLAHVLEQADHDVLVEIGDWIVDCRDAEELLKRCPSSDA